MDKTCFARLNPKEKVGTKPMHQDVVRKSAAVIAVKTMNQGAAEGRTWGGERSCMGSEKPSGTRRHLRIHHPDGKDPPQREMGSAF